MFRITCGKGFQIEFPNGWMASVQWGVANYCDNRQTWVGSTRTDEEAGREGSATAEVAYAKISDGYWRGVDGYKTPSEVVEFLDMVQNFDHVDLDDMMGQRDIRRTHW